MCCFLNYIDASTADYVDKTAKMNFAGPQSDTETRDFSRQGKKADEQHEISVRTYQHSADS
jgi:hypothetical protein